MPEMTDERLRRRSALKTQATRQVVVDAVAKVLDLLATVPGVPVVDTARVRHEVETMLAERGGFRTDAQERAAAKRYRCPVCYPGHW